MIGFIRRAVGADVGGTALSTLLVAARVERGAGCLTPPSVRWLALTTVSVAEADQGTPPAAASERGDQRGRPDPAGRTDTLLVDLDLRNDSDETVRISAGQFRLRLSSAVSVSHHHARQRVTAVPPGRTVGIRIAYSVPRDAVAASLDFRPVGATRARRLPLHPIHAQPA